MADEQAERLRLFAVVDPSNQNGRSNRVFILAGSAEEAARIIGAMRNEAPSGTKSDTVFIESDLLLVPKIPTKPMLNAAWACALAEDAAGVWESMTDVALALEFRELG